MFTHKLVNPYSAQENGMAKRAVQTAKKLLQLDDPELGLLNYRSTPHSATGVSPAQALMGKQVRTRLPVLPKKLLPKVPDPETLRCKDRPTNGQHPLCPIELPERPWEVLGTDLFEFKKKTYIVLVDYYSRWIEVKQLTPQATTTNVISRLKSAFISFGIPEVIISDNGPQFASREF